MVERALSKSEWEKQVLEKYHGKCVNCGSDVRVRVRPVVPVEVGGEYVLSNGTSLCRSCDLVVDSRSRETKGDEKQPVNFWVSRGLHNRVLRSFETRNGFTGMGPLVRYVMSKYVLDEERFDDLEQYQDEGTDVKVNLLADGRVYDSFKRLVNKRGLTVTDAVKSLLVMYQEEAVPLMKEKEKKSHAGK